MPSLAKRFLWILSICFIAFPVASAPGIVLRDSCPGGFELTGDGCELRSLYQMYPSLVGAGVGGLKTGLPVYRDKFSPQQIDLGRYLFFDPILSINQDLSCASCHDPEKGFSDGRGRSIGADNMPLMRSAPTLWNVAFLNKFFWDARASTLEEQMLGPLYDDSEMGNTPENLLATLNESSSYRALFDQAWPDAASRKEPEITLDKVYIAIAAFQASLVSLNSRYDRYAHGYADALTEKEKEGMNVFRSFVARCGECHTPPMFTNQQIAVLGTPEPEGMPFDVGAQKTLQEPTLRGGFKVPTLRNIELTAPYMHSGRFETLREAVAFYTGGRGHAVPDGESLKIHWHIWEPGLADHELDRLVDFLKTLTDESFKPQEPDILPSGMQAVHH
ncbi:MAG: cytochrome-c peroxidase [Halioglobus sp.]